MTLLHDVGGVGSLPDCVPVGHRAPEGDPHRDEVAADPRTENDQIKMYESVCVCVRVCEREINESVSGRFEEREIATEREAIPIGTQRENERVR